MFKNYIDSLGMSVNDDSFLKNFSASLNLGDYSKHQVNYYGKLELTLPVVPKLLEIMCRGTPLSCFFFSVEIKENTIVCEQ